MTQIRVIASVTQLRYAAKLKRRILLGMRNFFCFGELGGDDKVDETAQIPEVDEDSVEEEAANEFLNISKLFTLVRHKYAISMLLHHFLRYVLFILFFAVVVLMQRNASAASEMSAGIYNKFMFDTYRDSGTYEILGWKDVFDFGNFWDYHRGPFLKNFYIDTYVNERQASAFDRQFIESHIKLVGGFQIMQRRAKNGTCSALAKFSSFDSTCYGFVSLDGLTGSVDRSDFVGANNMSTYKFQQLSSAMIFKEEGYYQVILHVWSVSLNQ